MSPRRWFLPRPLVAALLGLACASCGGAEAARVHESDESAPAPKLTVALRFVPGNDDVEDIHHVTTRVLLVRIDQQGETRATDLGPFPGVCNYLPLRNPALLRARCGWLDQRVELVVTRHGDMLVAVQSSTEGERSEWREVARVELPEHAVIDALHPETLPVE